MKKFSISGDIYYKTINYNIARDIIEKVFYYSPFSNKKSFDYELPDGNHIILKDKRNDILDILFDSNLTNKQGIFAQTCIDCIKSCDIDIQGDLKNKIFLYGGTTKIYDFKNRLHDEMYKLGYENINIYQSSDDNLYKNSLAYNLYQHCCYEFINKEEYEEQGATIIHRKFFI